MRGPLRMSAASRHLSPLILRGDDAQHSRGVSNRLFQQMAPRATLSFIHETSLELLLYEMIVYVAELHLSRF